MPTPVRDIVRDLRLVPGLLIGKTPGNFSWQCASCRENEEANRWRVEEADHSDNSERKSRKGVVG